MSKVWFVTGSSRGLGHNFVEAAQGHQMIQQVYADRLKTWADWQDLSLEAHGKLDQ